MSIEDRQLLFNNKVKEHAGPDSAATFQGGISNAARVISGGIIIGVPNLANTASQNLTAFACCSRICLLPELEIYLGFEFKQHLPALLQRLQAFTSGINNTTLCIGQDGFCYLNTTKTEQPSTGWLDNPPPANLQPGISVDRVYFSLYTDNLSSRSRVIFEGFLGKLHSLFGANKVVDLRLWLTTPEITPEMRRSPVSLALPNIEADIQALGGEYGTDLIRRFHNGLNYLPSRHFVILTGVSGSGKTSLAKRYAYAVHGINSLTSENPLFFTCRVRPDWTDPAGLLGFYDVFTKKYAVPEFLKAIITANAFPDSPVFILLDEMNLARVEYYLADILSIFETPQDRLRLHTNQVPYQGDNGSEVPESIPWPNNLYIVGAINIDETTNLPSPKVLDRAVVIDTSKVDLTAFGNFLKTHHPELTAAVDDCSLLLVQISDAMVAHNLGFGYRSFEEVIRYVAFSASTNFKPILDEQLCQKILIKLKGSYDQQSMLEALLVALRDYPESTKYVERLQTNLEEFGSFQAIR